MEGLQGKKVVDIAAGQRHFLVLTEVGELFYGHITQATVATKGSKPELFVVSALEGKTVTGIACSYTNVSQFLRIVSLSLVSAYFPSYYWLPIYTPGLGKAIIAKCLAQGPLLEIHI